MSEIGDTFKAFKEFKKKKKKNNILSSWKILIENNIKYAKGNENHYIIEGYIDFWPSTGLFKVRKTTISGRGVHNLLKILNKRGLKNDIR